MFFFGYFLLFSWNNTQFYAVINNPVQGSFAIEKYVFHKSPRLVSYLAGQRGCYFRVPLLSDGKKMFVIQQ